MRAAAVALAVGLAITLASATPGQAGPLGFGRPVRFAGPVPLDALPIQIGVSPAGSAAIGFGLFDADKPAGAQGELALTNPADRPSAARAVPHSRQVLDVGAFAGDWTVLAGTSAGGLPCCTKVQALVDSAHGFTAAQVLMHGLGGVILGRLVLAGSRQLATFASSTGVWVAQASRPGRFGAARRLSASGVSPQSLVAMAVHGGGTLAAWTQSPLTPGDTPSPPRIIVARGAAGRLPGPAHVLAALPAGTSTGALALAPNPWRPTLGWTQDTTSGDSQVVLADVATPQRPRTFQTPGEAASSLAGAADDAGDEVFAWETCDGVPSCQVNAVSRAAGGRFGVAHALGAIDAAGGPAVAVDRGGAAVIGWVSSGHVWVSRRVSATGHFRPAQQLPSADASDLRLAAAANGRTLAVWTEGSARTTLWASVAP